MITEIGKVGAWSTFSFGTRPFLKVDIVYLMPIRLVCKNSCTFFESELDTLIARCRIETAYVKAPTL